MKLERWGWYSLAVNVVLISVHAAIAAASGSLAVMAELVHNVTDLLTAGAVLLGLKLSMRKTPSFPYGLYKLENLVAAGLALMIFLTAYEIARDALFAPPRHVTVSAWMIGGAVITTAIPLVFSHFEMRVGQAANSPALIADAKEYRVHVFTTGLVFVALWAQWFQFPLDRLAALLIVVAVAKMGWDLLSDAMRVLLDASLEADTLLEVRKIIEAEPTVTEVKWVTGRNAGRFRFVEAGVSVRVPDLAKAQSATQRIETSVRAAVPHVERVLVHIEPTASTHTCYAVPLANAAGSISPHFGEAPHFALVTVRRSDGSVAEQRILSNPYRGLEKKKGIRVAEWLVAHKVDVVLVKENLRSRGPVYVFRDAGVEVREAHEVRLAEALAAHGSV